MTSCVGGGRATACFAFALLAVVLAACRPVVELGGKKHGDGGGVPPSSCDAGACVPVGCTTGSACEGTCIRMDATRDRLVGGVEPIVSMFYDGNGDRVPDVLVQNLATEDVSFHAGVAGGAWAPARIIGVGRMQAGHAIGDFSGDGIDDVFLREPEQLLARLLVGSADGPAVFGDVSIASDSIELVPHDADGDGDLDLLVARSAARCFDVHLNAGNGAFPFAPVACVAFPDGTLFRWSRKGADLDGDARAEVVGIPYAGGHMVAYDVDLVRASLHEVARWWIAAPAAVPLVTNATGDPALELVAMAQDGVTAPQIFAARLGATDPLCIGATPPTGVDPNDVADVDSDGAPDFVGIEFTRDAIVVSHSRVIPPFIQ